MKYAASRFKKAAARGQLRGRKNPLQPILCFFFSKPLQGYQVDTTSVLQTTIEGWWWLSKKNNNPVNIYFFNLLRKTFQQSNLLSESSKNQLQKRPAP